jgi:hypothetical protein
MCSASEAGSCLRIKDSKAHRLFASLNSKLESDKKEEEDSTCKPRKTLSSHKEVPEGSETYRSEPFWGDGCPGLVTSETEI